eukprot:9726909-Lingulodinium_polyedra.AAC.1
MRDSLPEPRRPPPSPLHCFGQRRVQLREVAGREGAPCVDRADEILHPRPSHAGAVEEREQGDGPLGRLRAVGGRGRDRALQAGQ